MADRRHRKQVTDWVHCTVPDQVLSPFSPGHIEESENMTTLTATAYHRGEAVKLRGMTSTCRMPTFWRGFT